MRRIITILRQQFLGAIALILVLGGAAYAATGDTLLLGRQNEADKATKLRSTGDGPALILRSKPTKPALRVSNSQVITNLNANFLQGKGPSSFLGSEAPQILFASASPITESGEQLGGQVNVPAAGRIVILVTGSCGGPATTIHSFVLGVDGDTRSVSNPGGGACSAANSWELTEGGLVDVSAQWNPSASSFMYGTVLILFQPA